jgi:hypothetical protein
MFKNFRDKIALSGVTVLMIGVVLLIFTFLSAYGFLTQSLSIIATDDLVRTFGEALAPLIATSIRIMYLGIMGWIASLMTIRGVTLIANAPKMEAVPPQPKPITPEQKPAVPEQKLIPQKAKPVKPQKEPIPPEAQPPEPEIVVIPPEEISQPAPQPQPQPQQPQNNDSETQPTNS